MQTKTRIGSQISAIDVEWISKHGRGEKITATAIAGRGQDDEERERGHGLTDIVVGFFFFYFSLCQFSQ